MSRPSIPFEASVFLNCPFDTEFLPVFRALIFTVEYCGLRVRCALEADNAAETRIEKIRRIVRESKFGIHDLSRIESNERGLPRFNMPFELGIFLGMQWGGTRKQQSKHSLVLAHERYLYQQYLSDLAGQDIRYHHRQPEEAIRSVRSWLQTVNPAACPLAEISL